MDKIKVTSQQRFDLVDMTRLVTYLENKIHEITTRILGKSEYYDAIPNVHRRPLFLRNFKVEKVGSPSLTLTITRYDSHPTTGMDAQIYDQDGKKIGGANSPTSRNLVVDASPTAGFIRVKHVATNSNSEPRKFYDLTSGKYEATVTTTTLDDWEVDFSATSASDSYEGVNIAEYTTNGSDDITIVETTDIPGLSPECGDIVSWTGSGAGTASGTLDTITDYIRVLGQMIRRMRYGDGASSRSFFYNPQNDAAFDEKGGIRFGRGDVEGGDAGGGLQDTFLRAHEVNPSGSPTYEQLTVSNTASPTVSGDLGFFRGKGVAANPPTTVNAGFVYSSNVDAIDTAGANLTSVTKYWAIGSDKMFPANHETPTVPIPNATGNHPWPVTLGPNSWTSLYTTSDFGHFWFYQVADETGVGNTIPTQVLFIPISVPYKTRVNALNLVVNLLNTIPDHVAISLALKKGVYDAFSETYTFTTISQTFYNIGSLLSVGVQTLGFGALTPFIFEPGDGSYMAQVRVTTNGIGAVAITNLLRVYTALLTTEIREASHVY